MGDTIIRDECPLWRVDYLRTLHADRSDHDSHGNEPGDVDRDRVLAGNGNALAPARSPLPRGLRAHAGNFITEFGPATQFNAFYVYITNTIKGQGPNYVSGITITTAGSGYQPETPITLTGGGGTGAIAVANTSPGTAAQSYQPAYGAAPGYDLATGLGTPNATTLVNCVRLASVRFAGNLQPSQWVNPAGNQRYLPVVSECQRYQLLAGCRFHPQWEQLPPIRSASLPTHAG